MSSSNSLNVQQSVVFGFVTEEMILMFNNSLGYTPNVSQLANSYAQANSWLSGGQTFNNASAIVQLFPYINGTANAYFTMNVQTNGSLNGVPVSGYQNNFGPILNNQNDVNDGMYQVIYPTNSAYFYPFSTILNGQNIIQVTSIGTASNPTPGANATANFSATTQTSQGSSPVGSTLTFTFLPGSTQTLSQTVTTENTISNNVTNGVENTTTSGTSMSYTVGVDVKGKLPFGSVTENNAFSQAWDASSSQTVNFTTSTENSTSVQNSVTITADLNRLTPNAQGNYVYTNSNSTNFTFVPGQQYVASIMITQTNFSAPVSDVFALSGGSMTLQAYN
jgi:hypothetical protein